MMSCSRDAWLAMWLAVMISALVFMIARQGIQRETFRETFQEEVLSVRVVTPALRVPFTRPSFFAEDVTVRSLAYDLEHLTQPAVMPDSGSYVLQVSDVASVYRETEKNREKQQEYQLVAVLPRSADFVMITLLKRGSDLDAVPLKVLAEKRMKVGYLNPTCKIYYDALFGAYGLSGTAPVAQSVPSEAALLDGTVDVLCLIRHEDASGPVKFLEDRKIAVVTYEDLDISQLKMSLPFAYTKHVDLRKHFEVILPNSALRRTLKVDSALFVRKDPARESAAREATVVSSVVKRACAALLKSRDSKEVQSRTTYFSAHFELHPAAKLAFEQETERLASRIEDPLEVGRPEHAVLEQFLDPKKIKTSLPLDLTADGAEMDVKFRYDAQIPWVKHVELSGAATERLPPGLAAGDVVRLTKQSRSDENDRYVITAVSATGGVRASTYPEIAAPNARVQAEEAPIELVSRAGERDVGKVGMRATVDRADLPAWFAASAVPGDPAVLAIERRQRVAARLLSMDSKTATFASESADPRQLPATAFERCATHPDRKTKAQCESARGPIGEAQPRGTWDRPCVWDSDCPFYQKNQTYFNHRGGCMEGGYCEMPVGVRRASFRKYEGEPSCHGCPEAGGRCCAKQKSPDYAFDLDEFERPPR